MTEIYFVRHAQPDLNIKDNFIRPLTDAGVKDAHDMFLFLKNITFDYFYSSTYKRSYQTIEELANYNNKSIIKIENLKERVYGNRDIPIDEYFQKQWNDFNFKCANGESLNDVIKRNTSVINDLLVKHEDKKILIGYHGTNLCALLSHYTKSFFYEDFLKIKPLLPIVIKMTFDKDKFIDYEIIYSVYRDYLDSEKLA